MGSISKGFSLLIVVILAVSSLMMIESANAQLIPSPSVPEFTVKFISSPYSVTTTDPYTGKSITQQYDNKTMQISITNQQYTYSNGSTFYLYYNIRTKGHFAQDWTELYPTFQLWANAQAYESSNYMNDKMPYIALTAEDPENSRFGLPQSKSAFTTISLPTPALSGQVDFQVKAMVGINSTFFDPTNNIVYDPADGGVDRPAVAYVTSSDWSNIQTINLNDGSVSVSPSSNPTQTPSPTPSVPELSSLVVIPLIFGLFTLAVILRHRKPDLLSIH